MHIDSLSDDAPALDWSPDGKALLVAEQPSDTSPIRLMSVDLATGFRKPLTNPPAGNTGDMDGKFSPDGVSIAFQHGGLGDLYVVAAQGESSERARRLRRNNPGVRGIAWSRDSRHIFFGSMEGGFRWAVWQIDRDGSGLRRILATGLNTISPAISPDGRSIAAEQEDIETNLMEVPLHDPSASHLLAPSSRHGYAPVYAPNGKDLAFISTRSGTTELWLAHADGSGARQLSHLNGDGLPQTLSWSSDSQWLLHALRRDGATNIWIICADTMEARPITQGTNRDISPVFSPDGRYVYYNSNWDGMPRI